MLDPPEARGWWTGKAVGWGSTGHCTPAGSCHLSFQVNNQRMTIPFKSNDYLQVSMRGHRLYLVTSFGLVVSFDGKDNAGGQSGGVKILAGAQESQRGTPVLLNS